jgi:hypothetical protein
MDTLHPGARRIVERVEEELGQAFSKDLRGRLSLFAQSARGRYGKKLNLHFVVRDPSITHSSPHNITSVGYKCLCYVCLMAHTSQYLRYSNHT